MPETASQFGMQENPLSVPYKHQSDLHDWHCYFQFQSESQYEFSLVDALSARHGCDRFAIIGPELAL